MVARLREMMSGPASAALVLLMLVGCLFLWVGVPLGWLWIGSQVQSSASLGTAMIVTMLGITTTIFAVVIVLSWLNRRHAEIQERRKRPARALLRARGDPRLQRRDRGRRLRDLVLRLRRRQPGAAQHRLLSRLSGQRSAAGRAPHGARPSDRFSDRSRGRVLRRWCLGRLASSSLDQDLTLACRSACPSSRFSFSAIGKRNFLARVRPQRRWLLSSSPDRHRLDLPGTVPDDLRRTDLARGDRALERRPRQPDSIGMFEGLHVLRHRGRGQGRGSFHSHSSSEWLRVCGVYRRHAPLAASVPFQGRPGQSHSPVSRSLPAPGCVRRSRNLWKTRLAASTG